MVQPEKPYRFNPRAKARCGERSSRLTIIVDEGRGIVLMTLCLLVRVDAAGFTDSGSLNAGHTSPPKRY
ncbi:MAG: hypothetical protein WKF84_23760 [Pyrinomonadaceae bacterium]